MGLRSAKKWFRPSWAQVAGVEFTRIQGWSTFPPTAVLAEFAVCVGGVLEGGQ